METKALELAPVKPQELTRLATDVAGVCKEIVLKTALEIQGRKYCRVEGWQSIATAHGCMSGSRDVQQVVNSEGTLIGYKAIGEIRRISDGVLLAQAEGYVGADEVTWFGGPKEFWEGRNKTIKQMPKRPDYAIRAMCQTRAISRVCRAAFAHVVVLMDAGLDTEPAEEVPEGGFNDAPVETQTPAAKVTRPATVVPPSQPTPTKSAKPASEPSENDGGAMPDESQWRAFKVPFGKNKGVALGDLGVKSLRWYAENFKVEETYQANDGTVKQCSAANIAGQQAFRDALDAAVADVDMDGDGK